MLGAAIDTPTPEILFWDDGLGIEQAQSFKQVGAV